MAKFGQVQRFTVDIGFCFQTDLALRGEKDEVTDKRILSMSPEDLYADLDKVTTWLSVRYTQ